LPELPEILPAQHVPSYAILCLPLLFTAGMTLMDTTDGMFMNLAYGWAFLHPARKVYYNIAITGLSVTICFFIGGIETLGLLPQEIHSLSQTSGFWRPGGKCSLASQARLRSSGCGVQAGPARRLTLQSAGS
jgi:HoxN/HupN/NixA family high-affinity nickel-transporter